VIVLRRCCTLLACAGSAIVALGPSAAAQQTPTFQGRSEAVLVPVSVLDKKGDFIGNLKAGDFHLTVDGKPVAINGFQVMGGSPPASTPLRLPPGTFINQASPAGQRNLVILLVDFLNTALQDRMTMRKQLLTYLAHDLQPGQEIALYGLSNSLVLLHPFTRDPAPLAGTAKQLLQEKGGPVPSSFAAVTSPEVAGVVPTTGLIGAVDTPPGVPQPPPVDVLTNPAAAHLAATDANPEDRGVDRIIEFLAARGAWRVSNFNQHSRAATTLEEFRQLARAVAGVPGKKTVVWLTGDPSALNPTQLHVSILNDPASASLNTPYWLLASTYEALNSAGISLYPVDSKGITNSGLVGADESLTHSEFQQSVAGTQANSNSIYSGVTDARQGEAANATLGMQSAAAETGGSVLQGNNNLSKLLQQAQRGWQEYYVLSFQPASAGDDRPQYHAIEVKVDTPGAHALARRGYTSRPEALLSSKPEIQKDIYEAVQSPVDLTGLPLVLKLEKMSAAGATLSQLFAVNVAAPALTARQVAQGFHYNLTFVTYIRDEAGKPVFSSGQTFDKVLTPEQEQEIQRVGFTYTGQFQAAKGTHYFGRVIVRDNLSGNVGSLTLALPW